MTLFWIDQTTSWIMVILCWWIVHQTADANFLWPNFLMRLGVGTFGVAQLVIAFLRLQHVPTPFAGPVFKACLIVMFIGIILFHWRRFNRL